MITLKKDPQRDFIILNISDPQLSDEEWDDSQNCHKILINTITELIHECKPDLITVSGDIAWSNNFVSYERFSDLIDSFGIPWAPVLGNHDQETSRENICRAVDIMTQRKHCVFEYGDPSLASIGNYIIRIEENDDPIHAIFMINSNNRKNYITNTGTSGQCWAALTFDQMRWYADSVDAWKSEGGKSSSIVMHIPLYNYNEAFHAALKPGINRIEVSAGDGMQTDCWNEGYEDSVGVCYESSFCGSAKTDNGMLNLITEKCNTRVVLAGHDHTNNYIIPYRGVLLGYSLKAGCGCYWDPRLNGGTVLSVASDGSITVKHHYIVPRI